jgi:hypothetical protein
VSYGGFKMVYVSTKGGKPWLVAGQTPGTIRLVPCDKRGYRRVDGRRSMIIRVGTFVRDYRPLSSQVDG